MQVTGAVQDGAPGIDDTCCNDIWILDGDAKLVPSLLCSHAGDRVRADHEFGIRQDAAEERRSFDRTQPGGEDSIVEVNHCLYVDRSENDPFNSHEVSVFPSRPIDCHGGVTC